MSIDFSAFTDNVIKAIGQNASPRVKQAFPILIRKLHEFCIEADVSVEEWMQACNLMVEAGKVSSEQRNEVVLVTDVLGIESLVDSLDHVRSSKSSAGTNATHTAILGPFFRQGVAVQPNGTSIIRQDEPGAPYTHLYGRVFGSDGKPLKGAFVDIWHDAPDGLYDAQSPEKPANHCRGRFETDAEGRYDLVCLKPTPYPIPFDHSAGKLLTLMDRHPYRPAHIHYMVTAEGHKSLVTQVFDAESKYLEDDSVFAVKDNLVVDFKPVPSSYKPPKDCEGKMQFELQYDIHLNKAGEKGEVEVNGLLGGEPAGASK